MRVVISLIVLVFLLLAGNTQAAEVCDYKGIVFSNPTLDFDCDWVLMGKRKNPPLHVDGDFSYFFFNYKPNTGECLINRADNTILIHKDTQFLVYQYFGQSINGNPYTGLAQAYRNIGARTYNRSILDRFNDCLSEIQLTPIGSLLANILETTNPSDWSLFYLPTTDNGDGI